MGNTSDKPPVRIGFVGVGMMGQCAHLKNYATLPDCDVVAIAEPRPTLCQAVASRYGVQKTYETGLQMLEQEELDGLVVSQPFDRHGQIVTPLYQHKIPIFSEKPLASSTRIAQAMLDALQDSGTWHMVGYNKRSDPATIHGKREIDRFLNSGELGKLRYVRITMPPGDWIAGGLTDQIHTDESPPDMPPDPVDVPDPQYQSFVNYYIHQLNLLRHLLGEPYRVTFADKAGVLLVAESTSGVTGVIEMSPYQTKLGWDESALVTFEHGYVKIDLPSPLVLNQPGRVKVCTPEGTFEPCLPPVHSMRQQASNFIATIRGEITPPCDATEALEDLKIADQYMQMWRSQ